VAVTELKPAIAAIDTTEMRVRIFMRMTVALR
jgi:hypothetical protein